MRFTTHVCVVDIRIFAQDARPFNLPRSKRRDGGAGGGPSPRGADCFVYSSGILTAFQRAQAPQ